MDDARRARLRVDVRDRKAARRRVPRTVLYAAFWIPVVAALAVLSPGALPVLKFALHWVAGVCLMVMAVLAWSSPARLGRIPVRWGLLATGAVFLALAAVETYAALM